MKKLIFVLFILFQIICSPAKEKAKRTLQSEKSNDIIILHTNDVHCGVQDTIGYDGLMLYKKQLLEKYNNYHLTFSYDGHNFDKCKQFLDLGGNVAVVFANQEMIPMKFAGYPVCDGNLWDMRYLDPKQYIVALHYHTTAANYDKKGNYIEPNDDFVIRDDNELVEWYAD